jgi:hypothetical protein
VQDARQDASAAALFGRATNNNFVRNLFDIFSTRDLEIFFRDLEVKNTFADRKKKTL